MSFRDHYQLSTCVSHHTDIFLLDYSKIQEIMVIGVSSLNYEELYPSLLIHFLLRSSWNVCEPRQLSSSFGHTRIWNSRSIVTKKSRGSFFVNSSLSLFIPPSPALFCCTVRQHFIRAIQFVSEVMKFTKWHDSKKRVVITASSYMKPIILTRFLVLSFELIQDVVRLWQARRCSYMLFRLLPQHSSALKSEDILHGVQSQQGCRADLRGFIVPFISSKFPLFSFFKPVLTSFDLITCVYQCHRTGSVSQFKVVLPLRRACHVYVFSHLTTDKWVDLWQRRNQLIQSRRRDKECQISMEWRRR